MDICSTAEDGKKWRVELHTCILQLSHARTITRHKYLEGFKIIIENLKITLFEVANKGR